MDHIFPIEKSSNRTERWIESHFLNGQHIFDITSEFDCNKALNILSEDYLDVKDTRTLSTIISASNNYNSLSLKLLINKPFTKINMYSQEFNQQTSAFITKNSLLDKPVLTENINNSQMAFLNNYLPMSGFFNPNQMPLIDDPKSIFTDPNMYSYMYMLWLKQMQYQYQIQMMHFMNQKVSPSSLEYLSNRSKKNSFNCHLTWCTIDNIQPSFVLSGTSPTNQENEHFFSILNKNSSYSFWNPKKKCCSNLNFLDDGPSGKPRIENKSKQHKVINNTDSVQSNVTMTTALNHCANGKDDRIRSQTHTFTQNSSKKLKTGNNNVGSFNSPFPIQTPSKSNSGLNRKNAKMIIPSSPSNKSPMVVVTPSSIESSLHRNKIYRGSDIMSTPAPNFMSPKSPKNAFNTKPSSSSNSPSNHLSHQLETCHKIIRDPDTLKNEIETKVLGKYTDAQQHVTSSSAEPLIISHQQFPSNFNPFMAMMMAATALDKNIVAAAAMAPSPYPFSPIAPNKNHKNQFTMEHANGLLPQFSGPVATTSLHPMAHVEQYYKQLLQSYPPSLHYQYPPGNLPPQLLPNQMNQFNPFFGIPPFNSSCLPVGSINNHVPVDKVSKKRVCSTVPETSSKLRKNEHFNSTQQPRTSLNDDVGSCSKPYFPIDIHLPFNKPIASAFVSGSTTNHPSTSSHHQQQQYLAMAAFMAAAAAAAPGNQGLQYNYGMPPFPFSIPLSNPILSAGHDVSLNKPSYHHDLVANDGRNILPRLIPNNKQLQRQHISPSPHFDQSLKHVVNTSTNSTSSYTSHLAVRTPETCTLKSTKNRQSKKSNIDHATPNIFHYDKSSPELRSNTNFVIDESSRTTPLHSLERTLSSLHSSPCVIPPITTSYETCIARGSMELLGKAPNLDTILENVKNLHQHNQLQTAAAITSSSSDNCNSGREPSGLINNSSSNTSNAANPFILVARNEKYHCNVCAKVFTKESQLSLHMNVHYFEKPFRCETCCTSFRNKGSFNKHKCTSATATVSSFGKNSFHQSLVISEGLGCVALNLLGSSATTSNTCTSLDSKTAVPTATSMADSSSISQTFSNKTLIPVESIVTCPLLENSRNILQISAKISVSEKILPPLSSNYCSGGMSLLSAPQTGVLTSTSRFVNSTNKSIPANPPTTVLPNDPRPFKCEDCQVAFRIQGHLAKHLRSKMHITGLEKNGKVPSGTYAFFDQRASLNDIDTSSCAASLGSLHRLLQQNLKNSMVEEDSSNLDDDANAMTINKESSSINPIVPSILPDVITDIFSNTDQHVIINDATEIEETINNTTSTILKIGPNTTSSTCKLRLAPPKKRALLYNKHLESRDHVQEDFIVNTELPVSQVRGGDSSVKDNSSNPSTPSPAQFMPLTLSSSSSSTVSLNDIPQTPSTPSLFLQNDTTNPLDVLCSATNYFTKINAS